MGRAGSTSPQHICGGSTRDSPLGEEGGGRGEECGVRSGE